MFPVGGRGDTERENMTIQRCIVAKKDEHIRFGVTVLVYWQSWYWSNIKKKIAKNCMLAEAEVILKEGKYDDSKMHCGKKYEHIRLLL